MSIFDNLLGRFRPSETKKRGVGASVMVSTWQDGQPQWSNNDFASFARSGYRKNSLIYSCVNYRANATASAQVQMKIGNRVIGNHPAKALIGQPNWLMTEYDFWYTTSAMCDLGGVAYWAKERSGNGRVIGLYPMRPDCVQPVLSKKTGIESFDYTLDGDSWNLPVQDVLAFSNFDPLEFYGGTSPSKVVARLIDIDTNVSDYIKVFFQNSAMLRGVIKTKNTLTDSEAARLRSRWRDQYGGVSNWGDVAVMDNDAQYIPMGSSFNDMAFSDLDARTEARICMTYGIPPILIGSKIGLDRSTFSNYKEARLAFWQDTMMPIFRHFQNEYGFGMKGEFGDLPTAEFQLDDIPAFAENRIERMRAGQEGWQTGLMTRNEARVYSGLPLVSGGDVFIDEIGAPPSTPPSENIKPVELGNSQDPAKDPIKDPIKKKAIKAQRN